MSLKEYEALRQASRYQVKPGHEDPRNERVIEERWLRDRGEDRHVGERAGAT